MKKARLATKRGYLPAAAVIILALITLAVAIVIYFNRDLILKTKTTQPSPTPIVKKSLTPKDSELPKPSSNTLSSDLKTEGLETYNNTNFGYKVNYPSSLKIVEAKAKSIGDQPAWSYEKLDANELQKVSFSNSDGVCQIIVYPNPQQLTLEQWIQNNQPKAATGAPLISKIEDTKLDTFVAKKLTIFAFDSYTTAVISTHNGKIYRFEYVNTRDNSNFSPEQQKFQQTCEQILSTFQFL